MAKKFVGGALSMRAAVLLGPKRVQICEAPLPEPAHGEVRVRVEGCGVCASNLAPWEGRPWFEYPMAPGELGHEAWGSIDKLGPGVGGLALGQRVAMLSYHSYAEFDLARADEVVALDASNNQPFPAEPLGCVFNIWRRCGIQSGQQVAIVGVGFLGGLLTSLASSAGAAVTAITRRPWALELAERMGASCVQLLDAKPPGQLFDVVIEAAGKAQTLELAGSLVRERGRLVIAGYHQDGRREVNMQLWNWRGIDVINAHERDPRMYLQGISEALAAVASGRLDPSPLYTHRFPLQELGRALQTAYERPAGFMKALVLNRPEAG